MLKVNSATTVEGVRVGSPPGDQPEIKEVRVSPDGRHHINAISSVTRAMTLVDLLDERAAEPRGSYTFLANGRSALAELDAKSDDTKSDNVKSDKELSFPGLSRQARAIAAHLRERAAPGSRALLLYPPGLTFLPAFFGCLHAGIIAVPAPPPETVRLKHSLPRLLTILEDAEPDLILTTASLRSELDRELVGKLDDFLPNRNRYWLATDDPDLDDEAAAAAWKTPALDGGSLAYLQYTSGSTASPRGVMVTHGNLIHNLRHLQRGFAYDADSHSVTWMPHFHDYGLVDGLLQPLYSNIPCHILPPLSILKRPLCWLRAMDRYGASHTHGPNFAYELCIQRILPN